jgi:hypothetical protein
MNMENEESEPYMAYMSAHEGNTFHKVCKKMTNKKNGPEF